MSTRFASVDSRTVTFELRSVPGSPNGTTPAGVVGPLLRTDDFLPSSNLISAMTPQAIFAPIPLQAGTQYFLGFRNIQGLGQLLTNDTMAEHLSVPGVSGGRVFFSFTNSGSYSTIEDNTTGSAPILALFENAPAGPPPTVASVPEPSSLLLVMLGVVGAAYGRRKQDSPISG